MGEADLFSQSQPNPRPTHIMNHACRIAVRQSSSTGKTYAGLASTLPRLSAEWHDIATFGKWFGGQMGYKPYKNAMSRAGDYADYCNNLAGLGGQ